MILRQMKPRLPSLAPTLRCRRSRPKARPAMPGRSQTLAPQAGGRPGPRMARAADPR